jgi:hypothetical protein
MLRKRRCAPLLHQRWPRTQSNRKRQLPLRSRCRSVRRGEFMAETAALGYVADEGPGSGGAHVPEPVEGSVATVVVRRQRFLRRGPVGPKCQPHGRARLFLLQGPISYSLDFNAAQRSRNDSYTQVVSRSLVGS